MNPGHLSPESLLLMTLHVFLTPITSSLTKERPFPACSPGLQGPLQSCPCPLLRQYLHPTPSTLPKTHSFQAVVCAVPSALNALPLPWAWSKAWLTHHLLQRHSLICSPTTPLACSPVSCLSLQDLLLQAAGASCMCWNELSGCSLDQGLPTSWGGSVLIFVAHSFIQQTFVNTSCELGQFLPAEPSRGEANVTHRAPSAYVHPLCNPHSAPPPHMPSLWRSFQKKNTGRGDRRYRI